MLMVRLSRMAVRATMLTIMLVAASTLLSGAARADSGDRTNPLLSPNPSSTQNSLTAVTALSSSNAWAVGYYANDTTMVQDTLIEHWNGNKWSVIPSPSPDSSSNTLTSVRAINSTNVWAAGDRRSGSGPYQTLIEHWNGTKWSVIPSPNPSSTENLLYGLSGGGSAGGVWAVGRDTNDVTGVLDSLILHWNGSKWVRVTSPNPDPTTNGLFGVRAPSSTDAWAVGQAGADSLILRWNGTKWSRVTSPNPGDSNGLSYTSGFSTSNAWSVGESYTAGVFSTLALHWNGTKWSHVTTPSPGFSASYLFGAKSMTASNGWAIGYYDIDSSHHFDTLILHWNGHAWSQVSSPNPSATNNSLRGIGSVSANDIWAVGSYYDDIAHATKTLVLHWNGTTWVQK